MKTKPCARHGDQKQATTARGGGFALLSKATANKTSNVGCQSGNYRFDVKAKSIVPPPAGTVAFSSDVPSRL